MENNIEAQMSAYQYALTQVMSEFESYKVLRNEYLTEMQNNSKHYEALTPLGVKMLDTFNEFPDSFPDAKKTFGKLVAGGHVKVVEVTAVKPVALVNAEERLKQVTIAYNTVCSEMILPFQFKATKTRNGSTTHGEAGAGKCAEVLAQIRSIDPDAEVNFNGRRVSGTIGNGIHFDYDVYGVSFIDSLRAKVNPA